MSIYAASYEVMLHDADRQQNSDGLKINGYSLELDCGGVNRCVRV